MSNLKFLDYPVIGLWKWEGPLLTEKQEARELYTSLINRLAGSRRSGKTCINQLIMNAQFKTSAFDKRFKPLELKSSDTLWQMHILKKRQSSLQENSQKFLQSCGPIFYKPFI